MTEVTLRESVCWRGSNRSVPNVGKGWGGDEAWTH
jgi:hypothetical protein